LRQTGGQASTGPHVRADRPHTLIPNSPHEPMAPNHSPLGLPLGADGIPVLAGSPTADAMSSLRPLDAVHSRVMSLFALLTVLSVVILITMATRLISRGSLTFLDVSWMVFFASATLFLTFAEIGCLRHLRESVQPELVLLVLRDELTGLYNRRYIADRIREGISRCRRYGRRMSVLYIDLDGFKQVNDTYGHRAGDAVLQQASRRLSDSIRNEDVLARMSGDEFVALLTDTGPSEAATLAIRLRKEFEAETFQPTPEVSIDSLSFSVGVSAFPDDGETCEGLLSVADKNLYAHKASR